MVDIDARRRLSDALRALVAGLVTNDEFEARLPDLRSADRAIGALFHHGAWFLYSDLSEHRLTGRHALSPQARRDVARWVLFLLLLAFGADSGAYFAGRAFGRVRLAPSVSPGKTWEGVFGGLALALLLAWLAAPWLGVPPGRLLPVALCGATFSVVGDLLESLCKRSAGLKDSGSLFPGHGGVLDRIDSLLYTAPLFLHMVQYTHGLYAR